MSETKQRRMEKRTMRFALLFFGLTATCIAFAALCFFQTESAIFVEHATLFTLLTSFFLCVLCAFSVFFLLKKKEVLVKTMISVYAFLLFCLFVWFILIKMGFFRIIRDAGSLQSYIKSAGVWMPLLYILLQYLQVVVLPIPSLVSTVAGVALFGPFYTVLYSLIGIMLGSLTAFLIGRKLGNKAVAWMVGADALQKWQKKLKGKDNFILTLMFLLPLFPDDILCFIAGLSSMSFLYFIVMVFTCRVLAITTTCYSINFIPFDTWWGLCIWGALFIGLIVAFILIYKNLDKIQALIKKRFKKKK